MIRATLLCLVLGSWLAAAGPQVLFMSFDGLGATRFTPRTLPRLWKLSRQGLRGEGLPPFPSTTFNGHATLATGCWPGHHGIVGNGFLDPEEGRVTRAAQSRYLQREPLWVASTRAGVRTAVFHWPCATGPWHGVSPWRLEAFREGTPDARARAFCTAALAGGAGLVMAYSAGIDEEGHRFGPDSPQVRARLDRLDRETAPWLRRMLKLHPGLRVVLAGDHGMVPTPRRLDLGPLLPPYAQVVSHGGSAYVHFGGRDPGPVPAALAALGVRVWRRQDLPGTFHLDHARVGDWILEGPLGTWFAGAQDPEADRLERLGRLGAHGYDPAHASMHTWLVVLGTGRRGGLPPTELWDLAPTIARWLSAPFEIPPDGRPLEGLD
jgi:hypothetical protein